MDKKNKHEWLEWAKKEGNITPVITDFLEGANDECFNAKQYDFSTKQLLDVCLDDEWQRLNGVYKQLAYMPESELHETYDNTIRSEYKEHEEPKDNHDMVMQLFAHELYSLFTGWNIESNIAQSFSSYYSLGLDFASKK